MYWKSFCTCSLRLCVCRYRPLLMPNLMYSIYHPDIPLWVWEIGSISGNHLSRMHGFLWADNAMSPVASISGWEEAAGLSFTSIWHKSRANCPPHLKQKSKMRYNPAFLILLHEIKTLIPPGMSESNKCEIVHGQFPTQSPSLQISGPHFHFDRPSNDLHPMYLDF